MRQLKNVNLSRYTTFRLGGVATKLFFPQSIEELMELYCKEPRPNYFIGGGSNLLINDEAVFDNVICLREFNTKISAMGDGQYYVGASVSLQKFILAINADNYGGIEYLYSVPGLIGGAICMNAGRGKQHDCSISDYLLNVECLVNGEIRTINKEKCQFKYRDSIFQHSDNGIILGAVFKFSPMDERDAISKRKERIALCKRVQDTSLPNSGSVFCESNKYIMTILNRIGLGYPNGIAFSRKTKNWLINRGNGTFRQAKTLIDGVKRVHRLFRWTCRIEVKIWE